MCHSVHKQRSLIRFTTNIDMKNSIPSRIFFAAAVTVGLAMTTATVSAQANLRLTGVAIDVADGNRFFTRLGGTVRDDLVYEGLVPGRAYTVTAQLVNLTTGARVGEAKLMSFQPQAPTGKVSIELPMPQNRSQFNIDFAVITQLYEGEVTGAQAAQLAPLAKLDNTTEVSRVMQSHAIQSVIVTALTQAGKQTLPAEGGKIEATVAYANLVEGYAYTVWGQLLTPSGQATGIYASIADYAPKEKKGSVQLTFAVPKGFDGISLVPVVGLYHKKRVKLNEDGSLTWIPGSPMPVMIASDLSLDAPEQTIKIGVPFEETAAK